MDILYLSGMASLSALDDARRRDPQFGAYSAQKFHRLIARGFIKHGHNVQALSTFFLPRLRKAYKRASEEECGIQFRYVPSPRISWLRHLWMMIFCFFYVLIWTRGRNKEKVLVADVLHVSACMGGLLAARVLGLKRIGIMTDMPGLMVNRTVGSTDKKKKESIATQLNKKYLGSFSHYVFLTEPMNTAVNVHHRPYIIMEGLVDESDLSLPIEDKIKQKRVILYAGGLHERYGLKLLVEGFIKANVCDSELWLYGDGPFVKELTNNYCQDPRIIYKGIQPNEVVVAAEHQATLLVNPRPTHEDFTKYSFPSKNMEYMASGTPLLTTRLPGMPSEYYPYVYLFEEETVDSYANIIKSTLSLPITELKEKGEVARKWVVEYKNNYIQTERIINLIS